MYFACGKPGGAYASVDLPRSATNLPFSSAEMFCAVATAAAASRASTIPGKTQRGCDFMGRACIASGEEGQPRADDRSRRRCDFAAQCACALRKTLPSKLLRLCL